MALIRRVRAERKLVKMYQEELQSAEKEMTKVCMLEQDFLQVYLHGTNVLDPPAAPRYSTPKRSAMTKWPD